MKILLALLISILGASAFASDNEKTCSVSDFALDDAVFEKLESLHSNLGTVSYIPDRNIEYYVHAEVGSTTRTYKVEARLYGERTNEEGLTEFEVRPQDVNLTWVR